MKSPALSRMRRWVTAFKASASRLVGYAAAPRRVTGDGLGSAVASRIGRPPSLMQARNGAAVAEICREPGVAEPPWRH